MAGQMIMHGSTGYRIPVGVRRLVTMVPAFIVVALGVNSTDALVYSQVVLSFALPVPMIALVILTCRRDVMGPFANRRAVASAAILGTVVILALNAVLLLQNLWRFDTGNVIVPALRLPFTAS
jgi:manganese transport protein